MSVVDWFASCQHVLIAFFFFFFGGGWGCITELSLLPFTGWVNYVFLLLDTLFYHIPSIFINYFIIT